MEILEPDIIEQELIKIIKEVCEKQKIVEEVTSDFCPGKYIMSQILVSLIPKIEIKTGISIPNACYIFHDNKKNRKQLSIRNAVEKILKLKVLNHE